MHILFLTENYPPEVNAAATRVYERAVYWVRAGHRVTVLTCFPNFPQGRIYPGYRQRPWQRETVDGIEVIRLPTYVSRNEGFARRTLDFVSFMVAAVIASPFLRRPDVVVATSPQFFAAVAGWLVSLVKWRPFVFELGDLWPASIVAVGAMRAGPVLRAIERLELFLYRRSASVVALTPAFKRNLIARGIARDKIAVVINGVDLSRYAPRPRCAALERELGLGGKHVVGYLGTHGMAHDLGNVLAAADLLRDQPDVHFLFLGDGATKPQLEREAQRMDLPNVTFVAPRPKEQMPDFWSICDVALIHLKNDPTFAEVIPSKMFEAMGMGCPLLVVSPPGEAQAILENSDAGVWVPAADPRALADAVRHLAADSAGRVAFARRGLAAAPGYSRERQARRMIQVLEQVVVGRGRHAAAVVVR